MTGLPILEISGLNKSYGAVRAVDDVSLHVNRGEICGLIGPNGSGKSTFFDCASGLTKPQAGTVKLDGQDITGWSLNRIAREGRMLRSFQKTVVFSALDVEENLVIAGQMFTFPGLWSTFGIGAMARTRVEALRERAREFIKIAGLWDVRHQPAGKLSGGQQKLIQFASRRCGRPISVVDPSLSIKGLRAGYGSLDILNGVDLDVPQGQFVALMGPNGAGKSTLLKSLYGMTTIKDGSIEWRGKNIAAYTLRDARVKSDRDYVYDLFPILKTRRNTLAGNMSGGEQQLLEVAMAVLQRPKILLVDEPSVGLSPAAIAIVFNELLRINAGGQTILLVEQNTKKAMEVAHRAVILRLGKVIWDGRPADITHDELGELFLTGRMRGETKAEH